MVWKFDAEKYPVGDESLMTWQQTELSVPFPTLHGMFAVGKPSSTVPPAKEDISPQRLNPFFFFFPSPASPYALPSPSR